MPFAKASFFFESSFGFFLQRIGGDSRYVSSAGGGGGLGFWLSILVVVAVLAGANLILWLYCGCCRKEKK